MRINGAANERRLFKVVVHSRCSQDREMWMQSWRDYDRNRSRGPQGPALFGGTVDHISQYHGIYLHCSISVRTLLVSVSWFKSGECWGSFSMPLLEARWLITKPWCSAFAKATSERSKFHLQKLLSAVTIHFIIITFRQPVYLPKKTMKISTSVKYNGSSLQSFTLCPNIVDV